MIIKVLYFREASSFRTLPEQNPGLRHFTQAEACDNLLKFPKNHY